MNVLHHPDKIGDWDVIRHYETGHNSVAYLVCKDDGPQRLGKLYPAAQVSSRHHGIVLQEKLSHPNIVEVCDYNFECEAPFVVTEYAKEGTIRDTLHSWSTGGGRAHKYREKFLPIFDCVGWLHTQGISHNSLRSDHIFMFAGTPKIAAFRDAQIHTTAYFDTSKDITDLARAYNETMQRAHRINQSILDRQAQKEWQDKCNSLDLCPPKPLVAE